MGTSTRKGPTEQAGLVDQAGLVEQVEQVDQVGRVAPAPVGRPLDACPGCGSWQLRAVVDAEAARVHFLCGSCNRCWRVELGYARRVHPDRCDGCPQPQVCAGAYAKDQSAG